VGYPFRVPVFELELPARPSEVGRVRRAVRAEVVRYGLDGGHADTAQLLASELVMNAVLHGREPIRVRVSVERDCTVIEVFDAGDRFPEIVPGATPGRRGLHVVATLCSDWGVVTSEGGQGKTVWCSVPHSTSVGGAAEATAPRRRAGDRRG
jgi:anti-sigma regulatory factor (Ser/Thr protein kinase)